MQLGREIQESEAAQELTNAKAAEIFAFLDEVSCCTTAPTLASRGTFLYRDESVQAVLILM